MTVDEQTMARELVLTAEIIELREANEKLEAEVQKLCDFNDELVERVDAMGNSVFAAAVVEHTALQFGMRFVLEVDMTAGQALYFGPGTRMVLSSFD